MLTEKKKIKKHTAYKMRETESDYSWDLNVEKKALKKMMPDASDNEITIKAAAKIAKKYNVRRKDVLATVQPTSKAKGERIWNKEGDVILKESSIDSFKISPDKGYFACTIDPSSGAAKIISQLPEGESHFGGAYVIANMNNDLAVLNTTVEKNNGIPLKVILWDSNNVALIACYELVPDVEYFIVTADESNISTGIFKGTQLETLSYLDSRAEEMLSSSEIF